MDAITRRQLLLPFTKKQQTLIRPSLNSSRISSVQSSHSTQPLQINNPVLKKQDIVIKQTIGLKEPKQHKDNQIEYWRKKYQYSSNHTSRQLPDCFKTTRQFYLTQNKRERGKSLYQTSYETNIFGIFRQKPRLSIFRQTETPSIGGTNSSQNRNLSNFAWNDLSTNFRHNQFSSQSQYLDPKYPKGTVVKIGHPHLL